MERLTIPDVRIDEKTKKITVIDGNKVKEYAMEIYWHLKKIEDILGADYDLDRLRELVEADRDGRCVVLPCPFCGGDTVTTNLLGTWWCRCMNCGVTGPIKADGPTARLAWNTRAPILSESEMEMLHGKENP